MCSPSGSACSCFSKSCFEWGILKLLMLRRNLRKKMVPPPNARWHDSLLNFARPPVAKRWWCVCVFCVCVSLTFPDVVVISMFAVDRLVQLCLFLKGSSTQATVEGDVWDAMIFTVDFKPLAPVPLHHVKRTGLKIRCWRCVQYATATNNLLFWLRLAGYCGVCVDLRLSHPVI